MGIMTRAEIIAEGLRTAMRPEDDYPTQATGWLQRWLNAVASSWPWPLLQTEATGLTVSSGSLVVGNGSGGITERILRVLDNCWIYDSTNSLMQRVRIRTQLSKPQDRIVNNTTGLPGEIRIFATSFGQWTLRFFPNPNTTYYLTMPYIFLPDDMTADSDVPWYPNDETMIQAVAFKAHEFADGKDHPQTIACQQQLAGLLSNDRLRYGSVNGINDVLALNPARFLRAKVP